MTPETGALVEFSRGAVWVSTYPVTYAGLHLFARMTVIRLGDGRIMLHSPGPLTPALTDRIMALGRVTWIVAPGNFHHIHVAAAQAVFPDAEIHICPGVERKQPRLSYDAILSDTPAPGWAGEIEQVLVDANRIIREVAFFHRPSRTLVLTDLIELIGDRTPGVGWGLKFWWKAVTFMWNKPRPAPEYTLGWRDKRAAGRALERILDWDFDRIVIAHGDLITEHAHEVAKDAWARLLRHA